MSIREDPVIVFAEEDRLALKRAAREMVPLFD
jgi:hypothetical protein